MSVRRLRADRETCIGSGNCVRLAPAIFDQDDDGHVVLVPGGHPDSVAADVDMAVEACPVSALTWE
jgi:ferredoxin